MENSCSNCPAQDRADSQPIVDFCSSRSVNLKALMQGRQQLAIEHDGHYYILRLDRHNRLTLSR